MHGAKRSSRTGTLGNPWTTSSSDEEGPGAGSATGSGSWIGGSAAARETRRTGIRCPPRVPRSEDLQVRRLFRSHSIDRDLAPRTQLAAESDIGGHLSSILQRPHQARSVCGAATRGSPRKRRGGTTCEVYIRHAGRRTRVGGEGKRCCASCCSRADACT